MTSTSIDPGSSSAPPADSLDSMERVLRAQKELFRSGATRAFSFRKESLLALESALRNSQEAFERTLTADLGLPEAEILTGELGFVLKELKRTRRLLPRWCRPQSVSTPKILWPARSSILREPYGPTVIFSPWNAPLQLSLVPAIAALAAGNPVVLKPSEFSPQTSELLAEVIHQSFPPEHFFVVTGDAQRAEALTRLPFSYFFFTGSRSVGRKIYRAAAEHMSPVTLELGGKNPCVVCRDAKFPVTARRIAYGRFLNAGQTCVAPDSVYVHVTQKDTLLACLRQAIKEMYGSDPAQSPDYGRIVNQEHFERLRNLLRDETVYAGGHYDQRKRYFSPTIVVDPPADSPLLEDEIFGPILTVESYESDEQLQALLSRHDSPLALYVFTEDRKAARGLFFGCPSGSLVINDTMAQVMNPELPLGGVGVSGMGSYRGEEGLRTFSRPLSVVDRSTKVDLRLRAAPHSPQALKGMRRGLK